MTSGVQIIDIIDPYNPIPVYAVSEGVDGYTELTNAHSITAVTIGTSTFVLVASFTDSWHPNHKTRTRIHACI